MFFVKSQKSFQTHPVSKQRPKVPPNPPNVSVGIAGCLFVVEVTHLRMEDMQTLRLKMLAKVQKAQQGVKLAQAEEKDWADEQIIRIHIKQPV